MGSKKITPMDKHITIRVTAKEYKKALEYCTKNDMIPSEYLRSLIRFHLGMVDDFKRLSHFRPQLKK